MSLYELILICVFFLGIVGLFGYSLFLSHKERHELNNRLMCSTIDEFMKLKNSEEEKISDKTKPISQHMKLVSKFKAKGVNDS